MHLNLKPLCSKMRQLRPSELQQYLNAGHQPLLLDVREPCEFAICHIAGSELLPMRQIPTALPQLNPQQEIVVICHHGVRSLQVARFLEYSGFLQVINLYGGIDLWAQEVDPSMPTY